MTSGLPATGNWQRYGKRVVLASAMLSGSLGFVAAGQAAALEPPPQPWELELANQNTLTECEDSDGDGYGWNGVATCAMEDNVSSFLASEDDDRADDLPRPGNTNDDSDIGDQSDDDLPEKDPFNDLDWPQMDDTDSAPPSCVDSDGDGWGWTGDASCQMTTRSESEGLRPTIDPLELPDPFIDITPVRRTIPNSDSTPPDLTPCSTIPESELVDSHGICGDDEGNCRPYGQNVQYFLPPCHQYPVETIDLGIERPERPPPPDLIPCSTIPESELADSHGICGDDEGSCRPYGQNVQYFLPPCHQYPHDASMPDINELVGVDMEAITSAIEDRLPMSATELKLPSKQDYAVEATEDRCNDLFGGSMRTNGACVVCADPFIFDDFRDEFTEWGQQTDNRAMECTEIHI